VKRTLNELPESLDETYERVLRSINKANWEHARRLMQCITVAIRPLRVEELAEVLTVDFDAARNGGIPNLKPGWRWSDQHQAVLSTCSSLIAIVDHGDSQVVQFSHFSVKEFLTSDRLAVSGGDVSRYHILLTPAHTILAQACLGVLLRLDQQAVRDNTLDNPLTKYAARHWVDHAQFEGVSSRIQDVMEYFFDADRQHWVTWRGVYDIDDHIWRKFNLFREIPSPVPLYYAALCGFYDLAKQLVVKNPEHVNAGGGYMVAPLVAALYHKHFRVADLLLGYGADVNVRGGAENTPLIPASDAGDVDIIRWLLDHGADVNARNIALNTPLGFAADQHLEASRMLLEHNADVNAQNNLGKAPLHHASVATKNKDMLKLMQLLLDKGADPNVRDGDGCTPLHDSSCWKKGGYVPQYGTVEGSRLLLDHGANIDAKNNEGKTPLRVASEAGRHEMAEFLIGRGAMTVRASFPDIPDTGIWSIN
jgi:ankyrin repeat protein